ncbi:uncharacterized protein BYT42DRAFT_611005 [Radiomyces spectabilis]|uniref:uncharacterized protein n=1 Tax=Radiomyces spectabilis TaxID=64574 RepID=UPI00221E9E29|nr:uncharacterized protein BYT42DRAFT_611005 [Radiomyces spectabilis]KAI8391821.1 hypothetical protein BYT42DRAFT_611005 [Radiomyces spectabilis]
MTATATDRALVPKNNDAIGTILLHDDGSTAPATPPEVKLDSLSGFMHRPTSYHHSSSCSSSTCSSDEDDHSAESVQSARTAPASTFSGNTLDSETNRDLVSPTAGLSDAPPESNKVESVDPEQPDQRGNPAACIFVASLKKEKNDEELNISVSNHFVRWGALLNVKVLKDWLGRPYAFVQYERISDAKVALKEAPGTILDGRSVRCEPARVNRTLCLLPIDRPLDRQEVEATSSVYGKIEDITVLQARSRNQCAFVKYCYRDDAIRAFLSLHTPEFMQRWCVEWASNLDLNSSDISAIKTDKSSIFVGNLSEAITDGEMYSRFGHYGSIVHLRVIRKPTHGRKRVFAFVKYAKEEEAAAAVDNENGVLLDDRQLRVAYREHHESSWSRQQRNPLVERPHPPGMGFPASIYQYLTCPKTKSGEPGQTIPDPSLVDPYVYYGSPPSRQPRVTNNVPYIPHNPVTSSSGLTTTLPVAPSHGVQDVNKAHIVKEPTESRLYGSVTDDIPNPYRTKGGANGMFESQAVGMYDYYPYYPLPGYYPPAVGPHLREAFYDYSYPSLYYVYAPPYPCTSIRNQMAKENKVPLTALPRKPVDLVDKK